jgi:putative transposase
MRYDPDLHHRRSLRLPGYDYAQPGAYFVTICTRDRNPLFGEVIDGTMVLNEYGVIVAEEWARSAVMRQEIHLDAWIVMPDHLHGIVYIIETPDGAPRRSVGAHGRAPLHHTMPFRQPRSLSSLIAGFKSATTKRINHRRSTPGLPVWQRGFYDHTSRDAAASARIREHIITTPARRQQRIEQ